MMILPQRRCNIGVYQEGRTQSPGESEREASELRSFINDRGKRGSMINTSQTEISTPFGPQTSYRWPRTPPSSHLRPITEVDIHVRDCLDFFPPTQSPRHRSRLQD